MIVIVIVVVVLLVMIGLGTIYFLNFSGKGIQVQPFESYTYIEKFETREDKNEDFKSTVISDILTEEDIYISQVFLETKIMGNRAVVPIFKDNKPVKSKYKPKSNDKLGIDIYLKRSTYDAETDEGNEIRSTISKSKAKKINGEEYYYISQSEDTKLSELPVVTNEHGKFYKFDVVFGEGHTIELIIKKFL